MKLTIGGEDLTGLVPIDYGEPRGVVLGLLPDEALPPCNECEKPELTEANAAAVRVFYMISQGGHDFQEGFMYPVRFEAVASAVELAIDEGLIMREHRLVVHQRIGIIDGIYVEMHNARVKSQREAAATAAANSGNG